MNLTTMLKTIQNGKIFDIDSNLPAVMHPQSDPTKGQAQFCHKLIAYLFERGKNPSEQEFLKVGIGRQILNDYLKGICNITSHYGRFTIEILPSQSNQTPHQIQTDDIDKDFSKI